MRAYICTLGCKVNQYESDALAGRLVDAGFVLVDRAEEAELLLVNTCAVTSEAASKSRQAVARLRRRHPHARIVVLGCASELRPSDYALADIVGGAVDRLGVVEQICGQTPSIRSHTTYQELGTPHHTRIRPQIKVCDGCDNFCSYCIVPYLRGPSRSRDIASINAELQHHTAPEIVLTGINLSAYGADIGSDLTQLVRSVRYAGRKRLGSLECTVITPELLEAMSDNNFCEHFHLSLQSGSNQVLAHMNRHYTAEFFLSKVELIRSMMPGAGITTDIIVAYPTETESDFEQSLALARASAFADIHVFGYSRRTGTVAAKLPALDSTAATSRRDRMLALKSQLVSDFCAAQVGTTAEVVFGPDGSGYARNYCPVVADARPATLAGVRIDSSTATHACGTIIHPGGPDYP